MPIFSSMNNMNPYKHLRNAHNANENLQKPYWNAQKANGNCQNVFNGGRLSREQELENFKKLASCYDVQLESQKELKNMTPEEKDKILKKLIETREEIENMFKAERNARKNDMSKQSE